MPAKLTATPRPIALAAFSSAYSVASSPVASLRSETCGCTATHAVISQM